jgi:hypothetical protein
VHSGCNSSGGLWSDNTAIMWKLTLCYDGAGDPLLTSKNKHSGRQVWVYDAEAGSAAEQARVEELRAAFTRNRYKQRHSSDELLRLQTVVKERFADFSPTSAVWS